MAAGRVTHVVVGADGSPRTATWRTRSARIVSRVLADYHEIPFVVVAPTSTVDPDTASGRGDSVEERSPLEVSERFPAWNPAFDVTPARLVGAIVTEAGVHRAPYARSLAAAVGRREQGA